MTFDGPKIARRLKTANSLPVEVIYALVTTVKKFRETLRAEIKDLSEWEDVAGEYTAAELKADARKIVAKLLPRFKHNGFRDEREFRFVVHGADATAVKFRAKGSIVVPYIVLPLGDAKLPIKFLTVCPGHDAELTKKAWSSFSGQKDTQI
ncbi:hypothetical protein [Duganella flavida]|uniref:hypothetical protein n=1 Tax=Duganella flavida TaxID=2692175 RepID=UPI0035307113